MEMLESLAKLMLQAPVRYQQAAERSLKYDTKKAAKAGLSLERYRMKLRQEKIRHMVQDCVFGENDDIILFADCVDAFHLHFDVESMRNRAKSGYLHDHDFFELFYVLKGYCYQYIDGREDIIQEGSICLMNLQVVHERVIPDKDTILLLKSLACYTFIHIFPLWAQWSSPATTLP